MKKEEGYSPEYFDTLSINSSKGFAHILLIALLVLGLAAAIYLVQQKTNIFPKAYVSGPVTPPNLPGKYYLEKLPSGRTFLAVPMDSGAGYGLFALLKDSWGNVVTDQEDISYEWTTEFNQADLKIYPFASCADGILPPCPQNHANITTSSTNAGFGGNVWVKATRKSTNELLAKEEFVVNLVPKNNYVYFTNVNPGYAQGETYKSGQTVKVSWRMFGNPVNPVRYFNVYYTSHKKSGLIKTVQYPANSVEWIIPRELDGQRDVKIEIEPRIEAGNGGGEGHSDWAFSVGGGISALGEDNPGDVAVTRPPAEELVFDLSSTVTCSYSNLTGNAVMISWNNTADPVTKIELDLGKTAAGEPDIRTKSIQPGETSTNAPIGFSGNPEIIPAKTYYIRLYNGQYTGPKSFKIPSCMYTGK